MAKAYIANKPVRFDRNYKVGEVIPDGVISPQMGRRLVEMGRILCVDLPDAPPGAEPTQDGAQPPTGGGYSEGEVNPQGETTTPQEGAEQTQESADDEGGVNTNPDIESAAESNPDGAEGATGELTAADLINGTEGEFVCEVCGRKFQSQQGLAAHSRSHKE